VPEPVQQRAAANPANEQLKALFRQQAAAAMQLDLAGAARVAATTSNST
jgi:hypothetical protein